MRKTVLSTLAAVGIAGATMFAVRADAPRNPGPEACNERCQECKRQVRARASTCLRQANSPEARQACRDARDQDLRYCEN